MKTIRKNFLLLAFATGALFLIGNNVMADPTTPIQEPPGGGGSITCHQYALPGRLNQCWKKYADWGSRPITDWCYFTGYMFDTCFI